MFGEQATATDECKFIQLFIELNFKIKWIFGVERFYQGQGTGIFIIFLYPGFYYSFCVRYKNNEVLDNFTV